jgi:3-hydroxy acid dehydrogenase/malonic semialdehyde reductase
VTGASAGFGTAIARRLVAEGHRVIAAARRLDRLQALAAELGPSLLPIALDVTDREAVLALPGSLPEGWREVDVLVNNAGLALGASPVWETKIEDWERMIATNDLGLVRLTRALVPAMRDRNRGHIINLSSTAGSHPYPGSDVYGATKAFVTMFSANLRADLIGTQVRVTNIEPGLCGGTEFSNVRLGSDAKAAAVYDGTEPITAEDIADAVAWALTRPAHLNINRIEMMPTCQANAGLAVKRNT